jgi:hypothetical protein
LFIGLFYNDYHTGLGRSKMPLYSPGSGGKKHTEKGSGQGCDAEKDWAANCFSHSAPLVCLSHVPSAFVADLRDADNNFSPSCVLFSPLAK